MSDNYDEKFSQITDAMRQCGAMIREAKCSKDMTSVKEGRANFVTTYDKKVQETLRQRLAEIMPEAIFVGEEDDVHASIEKGFAFIVDPIDGTTNFIKDYHCSSISVGLVKDGQPFFGAVYNPYLDEMYTARLGQGAYLNGQPIHVSQEPLSHGIVLFGTAPYYEELSRQSFDLAFDYFREAMDIRRSGSAAVDLCSIAAGRAELYFELRLQPWDYAAGMLIVQEAGGIVCDIDGNPLPVGSVTSLCACNREDAMLTSHQEKWQTTGGAAKPVDLSKIEWANQPY